jgi:Lectin C-type domain
MIRLLCTLSLICCTAAAAEDAAPFLLPSVEDTFSSESAKGDALVAKAEAEAAALRKTAAANRLKAYQARLAEVTMSGDFDKAQAVKARIEQLEKEPESKPAKTAKRPRPKDTVRFGGHSYALIKELATWHVAKQRCEEMGGHLVCVNGLQEQQFVATLCGTSAAWVGATDETEEGQWYNVDGSSAIYSGAVVDNAGGLEHWMSWNGERFNDFHAGGRNWYVCEWHK